jgi:hypothetical protein
MIMQDAAVTLLAIAGAAILVRKITRAIRPKTAAACEHCPSGAAAVAKIKK